MTKLQNLLFNYRAKVIHVVDGDTVDFSVDLGFNLSISIRTRLIGINAPERFTPEGKAASEYLQKLLPEGHTFTISTDKMPGDKYGRWLASIWIDSSTTVNDKMLAEGHAKPFMV
jgi:micrococcal nuclease